MKFFRTHLSSILPLLFIMSAFEFILFSNATLKYYERIVNKDCNVIVTGSVSLDENTLKTKFNSFASFELLGPKSLIERLKDGISDKNLELLRDSLPKFYSIKFDHLPTQNELNEMENQLLSIKGISKIETFARTHGKVYSLLVLMKFIFWFFLFIIILLSFMLFLKQMRIWFYEHTQRVGIVYLFGTPFWLRSFMLYRVVIVGCLIVFIILLVFSAQIYHFSLIRESLRAVDVGLPEINFASHLSLIFLGTLSVCLLCVNFIMSKVKK